MVRLAIGATESPSDNQVMGTVLAGVNGTSGAVLLDRGGNEQVETVMTHSVDSKSKELFADAVCQLLRESRRRQKLTQAQVAARTGGLISKAALANYETGHRSLRVDVLWVIARALGENMGTLVAAAERGIAQRADSAGQAPITIDLATVRSSTDGRLAPVRRWVELQHGSSTAGHSVPGIMVLDHGAVAALSSLMGVSPAECRAILRSVAGRTGDPTPAMPVQGFQARA